MKSDTTAPTGIRSLPWLESFALGDAVLDHDHRALIMSFNDLCALAAQTSDAAQVQAAGRVVLDTVETHFASEDKLFRTINFQRSLTHMREHLKVVRTLRVLLLGESGMEPAVAAATARMTMVEHILRHDLEFKTWVLHAAGR